MPDYPATRTTDTVERRAGVSFADPYRWLEAHTDEVRRWQLAQAALATSQVRQWPHVDALRRSVAHFSVPRTSLPRKAGGRWFRMSIAEGATQARVVVADTLGGEDRVLFDPTLENPTAPPFLSWISPSPDGRTLALGVSAEGSENNTIRLIDVTTGNQLPDAPTQLLMDGWLGGAQWLADSTGFFYTALTGGMSDFQQAVFRYRLGESSPALPEPVPVPSDSRDYRVVIVSRCGRWAVATHGLIAPIPVALCNLDDPDPEWRPFVTDVNGVVAGHVIGDRYVAVSDVDAPRSRIVAIPLDSATPNDPVTWEEIVPESEAVIRSLTPVGDELYVTELIDTYSRIRRFAADGSLIGEVALSGQGAVAEQLVPIMTVLPRGDPDNFLFGFSTLTESLGIYQHRSAANAIETLIEPAVRIEDAVIEDRWATSPDGTRVPYHMVRLGSIDRTQPQPTLIFAYGAAGVPLPPHYPGAMASIIAAGGVLVLGHLRGGGEFGRDWWQAGTLKNRQNSYADLYAIAEDLIKSGATTPGQLGVMGGSAGGLMAGVAITQRPELWAVAVPRIPVLDLIGGCREPYLEFVAALEYGDIADPDEIRRIAGFSPYQLVRDGTAYPAVYIDAGDADPRCPPWHARKFAARLQAAQSDDAPILLHVWDKVGHASATARDIQIEQDAEWLAFAMHRLGLTPTPPADRTENGR